MTDFDRPALHVECRWSAIEAGKAYARPFGVTLFDDDGAIMARLAVNGRELLYLQDFRIAVLALGGELFHPSAIDRAEDPQRVWLNCIAATVEPALITKLGVVSSFDEQEGRVFHIQGTLADHPGSFRIDARTLLEYQEFQAAVAHQTGRLYREPSIEVAADGKAQDAWLTVLGGLLERPAVDDAMNPAWPWR